MLRLPVEVFSQVGEGIFYVDSTVVPFCIHLRLVEMAWDEEARLVCLVIASTRCGIKKDTLIEFLVNNVSISDPELRNNCFLKALEINEYIEKQHGKSVIPVALITEIVRNNYKSPGDVKNAFVVQKYHKMTATETSLPIIGEHVKVSEDTGEWLYIERTDGDAGWVPKECISFTASLDI